MKISYFSENCFYDADAKSLFTKDQNVHLTSKEILVLEYLLENNNKLCDNAWIYEQCWDTYTGGTPDESVNNSVKNVIKKLREKDPSIYNCINTIKGQGYKLILPKEVNAVKNRARATHRVEESFVNALEAYRNFWVEMDRVFLESAHARKVKQYFYTNRDSLPDDPADYQMGLAVAEMLRDTISYSEIILGHLPELGHMEDHFRYKRMVLESKMAKEGMAQFRFSSESIANLDDERLRYTGPIDLRAVISTAKIFLDIDKMFIMNPQLLELRPYFYEKRDELPTNDDQLSLGKSLCEMIKDQLQYSEPLLKYIPEEHEESYLRYRRHMLGAALMEESKKEYVFPWEMRL